MDDRGQAVVLGAVLLFGIVTIAFAGYQAYQVPNQNAQTEFQHFEAVQNDLTEVRNAVSKAGQQDQNQFESVRLGTFYRERAIAVNPPDPAGTLQTVDPGSDITVGQNDIETRFLKYENGYNELDAGSIYYENTVLYLEPENGERVFLEDQNIVPENGDRVTITALQGDISISSTTRETLGLYPTNAGGSSYSGDITITFPTRLSEEYWENQLANTNPISNFNYMEATDEVEITVNDDDITFNTVGIDNVPDGMAVNQDPDSPDQTEILRFDSIVKGDSGVVQFDVENTGSSAVTVTRFAIETPGFSQATDLDNGDSDEVNIDPDNGQAGEANDGPYAVDGTVHSLDADATINSGSMAELDFRQIVNNGGNTVDFDLRPTDNEETADLVVTVVFDDGAEQDFYFENS